ncbi:MAG: HAD hydrolase family protein, partial [Thermodesulfovibrionales bacterium]
MVNIKNSSKKLIIFTDLDGTLLDARTYSFEPAIASLKLLREKDIPLIICSSKTRKEIEYYRERLDNHHPFV